jgi:hypothetical protein
MILPVPTACVNNENKVPVIPPTVVS